MYNTQTHFFIIEILFTNYQDMCTYTQLKIILKRPQGVNGAPYVRNLYASSGKDISKCIEGGTMKLTTLVDYIMTNFAGLMRGAS